MNDWYLVLAENSQSLLMQSHSLVPGVNIPLPLVSYTLY